MSTVQNDDKLRPLYLSEYSDIWQQYDKSTRRNISQQYVRGEPHKQQNLPPIERPAVGEFIGCITGCIDGGNKYGKSERHSWFGSSSGSERNDSLNYSGSLENLDREASSIVDSCERNTNSDPQSYHHYPQLTSSFQPSTDGVMSLLRSVQSGKFTAESNCESVDEHDSHRSWTVGLRVTQSNQEDGFSCESNCDSVAHNTSSSCSAPAAPTTICQPNSSREKFRFMASNCVFRPKHYGEDVERRMRKVPQKRMYKVYATKYKNDRDECPVQQRGVQRERFLPSRLINHSFGQGSTVPVVDFANSSGFLGRFAPDPYFQSQLGEPVLDGRSNGDFLEPAVPAEFVSGIDSDAPSVFQRVQSAMNEHKFNQEARDPWLDASTVRDSAVAELLASYQRKCGEKKSDDLYTASRGYECASHPRLQVTVGGASGNFSSTSEEWTGRTSGTNHFDRNSSTKKYLSSRSTSESRVNLTAASYMLDHRRVTANFGCPPSI